MTLWTTRAPLLVHGWCTGARRSLTVGIRDHTERACTRAPGACTCSDQGKHRVHHPSRAPATQKPPLTRENAGRAPVHPFGADPTVSDPRSAWGPLVHAAGARAPRKTTRPTPPRGANQ